MIEASIHAGGDYFRMLSNPLAYLTKPVRITSWFFGAAVIAYLLLCILIFYRWMLPSLDGRSDLHIAADSATYMFFADDLREGTPDPIVMAALANFPNTLWLPVLIAFALKTAGAMVALNFAIFLLSFYLLKKTFLFSGKVFSLLLILNATTTISLLSVNKELIDVLTVAVLFFAYYRHVKSLLALGVLLAAISRFEVGLVILLFLFLNSRLNPLRRRRVLTLMVLLVGLSITIPVFAPRILANRFDEASSGGVIIWLDSLEMHYLYFLAVIPKIAQNFFGSILNPSGWGALVDSSDVANSSVLFLNNLASAIVCLILLTKRAFSTKSDIIYLAALGCLLMAASPVIQPRYFYFVYVLLCLRVAQKGSERHRTGFAPINRESAHA